MNGEAVFRHFAGNAHFAKLRGDCGQTVALLKADVSDAVYGGVGIREGSDDSKGDRLVRAGGHIRGDAVEMPVRGRLHQDSLRRIGGGAAHLLQNAYKLHVPLKGVEMYVVHPDGNA